MTTEFYYHKSFLEGLDYLRLQNKNYLKNRDEICEGQQHANLIEQV